MATVYDPTTKRSRYEKTRTALWNSRTSFDQHWKEIADFLVPRRMRLNPNDRNKGDKRNQNIIDNTGRFAVRTLAAGMHSGLTSPARPWMKLTTSDPDLAERADVKEWLHTVTQRMLNVFLKSNVYNTLPIVYGDMGLFGTGCMSIEPDAKDLFRCYAFPAGSYALGLDGRGLTSTFVREFEMSVGQVVEAYATMPNGRDIDRAKLSQRVLRAWDKSDYEETVQVCWIVQPNAHADHERLDAKYLPWSSCHFEIGATGDGETPKFLRESGFKTNPIMAPRWDITGEDTYGTDCPGMTALGDVKQLQIMHREKGKAVAKMVAPPLVGPTALQARRVSALPSDVTYVDTREGQSGLRPVYQVNINLNDLRLDINDVQYRIERAFYADLFMMIQQSDNRLGADRPTAREIEERHEEKLVMLGPVLDRTNDELLDPMVDRVYQMMDDAGLFLPPPEDLQGVSLRVEYISIMAQAQKLLGVVALDRYVQSTLAIAPIVPSVLDSFDEREVMKSYADMLGVPPATLRTDDEVQARAKARDEQQSSMMAAEAAKNVGTAVGAAGQHPIAPDSALDRLLQTAGAGA